MKYAIVDKRIPKKALLELKARGFEPILMPPFSRLSAPVASHPDMLMFFGDKLYFPKEYYGDAKKEIDLIVAASGLEAEPCDTKISSDYPNDIAFNALPLGDLIFCKKDSLCKNIKESGKETVNIAQGYAKCAAVKVSENAIITSDPSVAKAAEEHGIDVLKISTGHVALSGYDTGFIGGASGACENTVFFCGSLDTHPDGEKISLFCKKHKKEAVSLSDEPLYDIGTIFFI